MPTVEHDTQTASLLEQIDSLRSFTRQVAHDLRGPLVSVVCAAEHAQQALAGGDTRIAGQMLHLLATHAAGLHELVSELLALAHAGETPLCRAPIDMTALARSAAEQARLICNAGDSVAVQLLPLPTACGTEPLLRQVFVNLVCNAMKFTRHVEHPRIEIGWEPGDGGCAFFYVRDNGIGFDPRHAQRLFEPFSRLHGNDYPGHGIGLSIVRRVVERQWGQSVGGTGCAAWRHVLFHAGDGGDGERSERLSSLGCVASRTAPRSGIGLDELLERTPRLRTQKICTPMSFRNPLNEEQVALGMLGSEPADSLVGRGLVPALRMFHGRKLDHDEVRRPCAFQGLVRAAMDPILP